jgi:hypothetical protein
VVIFVAFDVAGRAVRVRSEQVGRQTAFLLEIETIADHGAQTAALGPDEALALGRALVLHATAHLPSASNVTTSADALDPNPVVPH